MLSGSPEDETDKAAEAFGIASLERPDEPAEDEGLWPENLWPARLFEAMKTQWRVGPAGPVGLDYNVREMQAELIRLPRKLRRDTYEALRDMEYAALNYFAERRE